ncbi:MAG: IS66 family transposase [Holophagales bacterium]|nr:IS66 family transposase [Holophagales bacterium]
MTNAQLHATEAELESSRQRLRESQLEIDKLKHRIDWLCRKLFGKSSEKVDPSQLALAFEQLAVEDAAAGAADVKAPEEDGPVETDSGEPRGRGKKKGHGRGALPANLPRRRVVIEVPAQERACSCCQREMTPFGEDVKLTLDYEPARITVVETVRVKYSCSKCHEGVVIAPVPDAVMDKGLPEAGMLAYVAVSKYADHLPLYRLERVMARSGLVISRNTLGDWIDFIADSFSSVIEAMKKKILKGPIVQSDDTKVRVLGGPEGSYAGYLWCYGGLHDEVVFDFTEGRGREGPQRFLDGYQGYLQVDAYAGYDVVFARGKVLEVACWAHVRRKIFEARTTDPKRADPLLGMIAALYAVEAEAKGLTADERGAEGREVTTTSGENPRTAASGTGRRATEEPDGSGRHLRPEPVGSPAALSRGWAPGHRQQRHGTLPARRGRRAQELALHRERGGRTPRGRSLFDRRKLPPVAPGPLRVHQGRPSAPCLAPRTAGRAAHTGRMEDYLPRDRRLRRRPRRLVAADLPAVPNPLGSPATPRHSTRNAVCRAFTSDPGLTAQEAALCTHLRPRPTPGRTPRLRRSAAYAGGAAAVQLAYSAPRAAPSLTRRHRPACRPVHDRPEAPGGLEGTCCSGDPT